MSELEPGSGRGAPEWFYAARDRMRERLLDLGEAFDVGLPPIDLRPASEASAPRAGEVRALFDSTCLDDPDGPMRLVLIRYLDEAEGYASVALISDDSRMAGGTDVVLPSVRTGLPYEIMIETDVVGPVWFRQLSAPLGAVDGQTLIGIIETEHTGVPAVAGAARGLPVAGTGDKRWGFKLAEAEELGTLSAPCMAELMERGDAAQAGTGDAEVKEAGDRMPLGLTSEEPGRELENGR